MNDPWAEDRREAWEQLYGSRAQREMTDISQTYGKVIMDEYRRLNTHGKGTGGYGGRHQSQTTRRYQPPAPTPQSTAGGYGASQPPTTQGYAPSQAPPASNPPSGYGQSQPTTQGYQTPAPQPPTTQDYQTPAPQPPTTQGYRSPATYAVPSHQPSSYNQQPTTPSYSNARPAQQPPQTTAGYSEADEQPVGWNWWEKGGAGSGDNYNTNQQPTTPSYTSAAPSQQPPQTTVAYSGPGERPVAWGWWETGGGNGGNYGANQPTTRAPTQASDYNQAQTTTTRAYRPSPTPPTNYGGNNQPRTTTTRGYNNAPTRPPRPTQNPEYGQQDQTTRYAPAQTPSHDRAYSQQSQTTTRAYYQRPSHTPVQNRGYEAQAQTTTRGYQQPPSPTPARNPSYGQRAETTTRGAPAQTPVQNPGYEQSQPSVYNPSYGQSQPSVTQAPHPQEGYGRSQPTTVGRPSQTPQSDGYQSGGDFTTTAKPTPWPNDYWNPTKDSNAPVTRATTVDPMSLMRQQAYDRYYAEWVAHIKNEYNPPSPPPYGGLLGGVMVVKLQQSYEGQPVTVTTPRQSYGSPTVAPTIIPQGYGRPAPVPALPPTSYQSHGLMGPRTIQRSYGNRFGGASPQVTEKPATESPIKREGYGVPHTRPPLSALLNDSNGSAGVPMKLSAHEAKQRQEAIEARQSSVGGAGAYGQPTHVATVSGGYNTGAGPAIRPPYIRLSDFIPRAERASDEYAPPAAQPPNNDGSAYDSSKVNSASNAQAVEDHWATWQPEARTLAPTIPQTTTTEEPTTTTDSYWATWRPNNYDPQQRFR